MPCGVCVYVCTSVHIARSSIFQGAFIFQFLLHCCQERSAQWFLDMASAPLLQGHGINRFIPPEDFWFVGRNFYLVDFWFTAQEKLQLSKDTEGLES